VTSNAAIKTMSASTRRQERAPWLVTLAIAAAFGIVIAIQGVQDFEQLEREAENTTVHAAELLHENATRALGEIALTLEDLRLALESELPGAAVTQSHVLRDRFFSKLVHLPQVEALVVLDAAGNPTNVSSLDTSFQLGPELLSWFASQRTSAGAGPTMGLVRHVQDNTWRVVLARKITNASGNVRAVVAAVIGAGYFQDLVRTQGFVGKGGVEFVLGLGGSETLLAHSAAIDTRPIVRASLWCRRCPTIPRAHSRSSTAGVAGSRPTAGSPISKSRSVPSSTRRASAASGGRAGFRPSR
jgi:hypothetical protein